MTPKGQTRDPNTLRVQYRENSWRCHLATIANYYCEAVDGRLSQRQLGCLFWYTSHSDASKLELYADCVEVAGVENCGLLNTPLLHILGWEVGTTHRIYSHARLVYSERQCAKLVWHYVERFVEIRDVAKFWVSGRALSLWRGFVTCVLRANHSLNVSYVRTCSCISTCSMWVFCTQYRRDNVFRDHICHSLVSADVSVHTELHVTYSFINGVQYWGDYAVAGCLSARPSVRHIRYSVQTATYRWNAFAVWYKPNIQVFYEPNCVLKFRRNRPQRGGGVNTDAILCYRKRCAN